MRCIVCTHETSFGDKKSDYCRLKLMAHRYIEQKIKESHFKAKNRDENRPAIGAPCKGKAEGKCKANAENNSERGHGQVMGFPKQVSNRRWRFP